jgi:hypothetical protein
MRKSARLWRWRTDVCGDSELVETEIGRCHVLPWGLSHHGEPSPRQDAEAGRPAQRQQLQLGRPFDQRVLRLQADKRRPVLTLLGGYTDQASSQAGKFKAPAPVISQLEPVH